MWHEVPKSLSVIQRKAAKKLGSQKCAHCCRHTYIQRPFSPHINGSQESYSMSGMLSNKIIWSCQCNSQLWLDSVRKPYKSVCFCLDYLNPMMPVQILSKCWKPGFVSVHHPQTYGTTIQQQFEMPLKKIQLCQKQHWKETCSVLYTATDVSCQLTVVILRFHSERKTQTKAAF